jgi:hypothetical protein
MKLGTSIFLSSVFLSGTWLAVSDTSPMDGGLYIILVTLALGSFAIFKEK